MPQVHTYQVRAWGGPNGLSSEGRARIQLSDASRAVGWIYFHDDGATIPNDTHRANGQIDMHLPASMLESVVDLLRNESPIYFTYAFNHAVLTTGAEEIGEGE